LISGTPTVFGSNFTFSVRATDANNAAAVASFVLDVVPDVVPLRVVTSGALTSGLTGVNYSTQLFFTGGHPPVTWAFNGGSLPPGLLVSTGGVLSGRPTTAGNYTFTVRVTDSDNTIAVSTALTLQVDVGPLGVIDTGALTAGMTGSNYSYLLRGTGGTTPYTWAVNSGVLPPGLLLNPATGAITGIPTVPGQYDFVVRITDSTTASASSDPLRIVVTAGPLVVLTTGDLTAGKVNVDYAFTLLANGGKQPYTWSVTSGALPTGLTLDAATGAITGKPTAAGTFPFTVQVRDASSSIGSSSLLRIIVSP
ncbi:MAG TPA: Ig domain-containing protein, partial [Blastocatellia bacterium]|nr:Ig domain-containing protein [Blastocatellia bacterium]